MRIDGLPARLRLVARHYAKLGARRRDLPDPEAALSEPDGLAGLCSDLSVPTLLQAYGSGLYPQACFGPQKWWAPQERMVLFIENFRLGSRVVGQLHAGRYRVSFDSAFEAVVAACATPRLRQEDRGWIRRDLKRAFANAFRAGVAHSVEVWDESDRLVAGAYGLAVGKVFFTEAHFADRPDAGKIGLATLNCHLQRWGYLANDAKRPTGALCQQGFSLISRSTFNAFLAKACAVPSAVGHWRADEAVRVAAWQPQRMALGGAAS